MTELTVEDSSGEFCRVVIDGSRFSCMCAAASIGAICRHVRHVAQEHDQRLVLQGMEVLDHIEPLVKEADEKSVRAFHKWRADPTVETFKELEWATAAFRQVRQELQKARSMVTAVI